MIRRLATRAMNLLLRGLGLAAKFALVFSLARFLDPADVGLYGLVLASVTYAQFALGFDFHVFANREFIGAAPDEQARILRDQAVFLAAAYVAVLPICLLPFGMGVLPWKVVGPFYALLVLEHVAHELSRILIAMSRPVLATALFFLRAGAWILVVLPVMWLEPAARTLGAVFIAWIAGGLVACAMGAAYVFPHVGWKLAVPVDWRWIRKGLRVAVPLLVGTLALKGLYTFDRYWIEAIGGLEPLGAYVLFAGIATAIKAFLDAGVFIFSYPGMIRAARDGDDRVFHARMRRMAWHTLVTTLGLCAVTLALTGPLLGWIGRTVYVQNLGLLYWSMLGVVLYAASMVFHYAIYARHGDSAIVRSHLAGLAMFLASAAALQRWFGVVAVPMAICSAYATILVWKALKFGRMGALVKRAAPRHA